MSCLPCFAQPYRLVANTTIEAFFSGARWRADVRRYAELLGRYRRHAERWFPDLRTVCGVLFGRSPPWEDAAGFRQRVIDACGGLASATGTLVRELAVTFFGRYRCHQRRLSQA